jgi:hypothetical protein
MARSVKTIRSGRSESRKNIPRKPKNVYRTPACTRDHALAPLSSLPILKGTPGSL